MIRQTVALFVDGYRDLNSRMLFWITLGLTIIVVIAFGTVGATPTSITFLHYHLWDRDDAGLIYRGFILSVIIIGFWLSWAATILAIISTAGIFPDLIVGGSIDLYLSKPISRLRLFLTKYVVAMLFVALQVTIFSVGCFFVMGLRAHEWRPSLFLAIPFITLMFSYVYAFCVLLGVWTRSTVAAILLSILLWLIFSLVARADIALAAYHLGLDLAVQHAQEDIARIDGKQGPTPRFEQWLPGLTTKRRQQDETNIAEAQSRLPVIRTLHRITSISHAIFPKTAETNNLLDRYLIDSSEIPPDPKAAGDAPVPGAGATDREIADASQHVAHEQREQSAWYVIGSSLICEAVVVGFAAWIFCRRDY